MKQYQFNLDKFSKALETSKILENMSCRMYSIKDIIENRETLGINEYYCDILYSDYIELEKEMVTHIKKFYNEVYDSFKKYDDNLELLVVNKEKEK